jgi:hypothetical protein
MAENDIELGGAVPIDRRWEPFRVNSLCNDALQSERFSVKRAVLMLLIEAAVAQRMPEAAAPASGPPLSLDDAIRQAQRELGYPGRGRNVSWDTFARSVAKWHGVATIHVSTVRKHMYKLFPLFHEHVRARAHRRATKN